MTDFKDDKDSTVTEECNFIRESLKGDEDIVRGLVSSIEGGEVKAQAMLAVRHIEDARMRLGKVIQYSGDGVSCYDKDKEGANK